MKDLSYVIKEYQIYSLDNLMSLYSQSEKNSWFVFDLNLDSCHYICPSIQYITGLEPSEYIGKGTAYFLNNVFHPEDYTRIIGNLVSYIFHKRVDESAPPPDSIKNFSFRIKHKQGYWLKVNGVTTKAYKSKWKDADLLMGFLHRDFIQTDKTSAINAAITLREKEVLELIGNGYSSKIIANKLYISETTAISHRKNLIQKFNVRNTAELIKKAVKAKLIE